MDYSIISFDSTWSTITVVGVALTACFGTYLVVNRIKNKTLISSLVILTLTTIFGQVMLFIQKDSPGYKEHTRSEISKVYGIELTDSELESLTQTDSSFSNFVESTRGNSIGRTITITSDDGSQTEVDRLSAPKEENW